jgi:hypothetical protein
MRFWGNGMAKWAAIALLTLLLLGACNGGRSEGETEQESKETGGWKTIRAIMVNTLKDIQAEITAAKPQFPQLARIEEGEVVEALNDSGGHGREFGSYSLNYFGPESSRGDNGIPRARKLVWVIWVQIEYAMHPDDFNRLNKGAPLVKLKNKGCYMHFHGTGGEDTKEGDRFVAAMNKVIDKHLKRMDEKLRKY